MVSPALRHHTVRFACFLIGCVAGTRTAFAQSTAAGEEQATQARLMSPAVVVTDRYGNIYVSERNGYRVRRIDARTGAITTVAGTGEKGYGGDGGPATSARFDQLSGLAVDSAGDLYVGDLWNSRIRKVDARTGVVTTVVGSGIAGYGGDNGPATGAAITAAFDIAFDRDGNLIFADTENHRIRRVNARTGIITTIAGSGRWGFAGDGGPATDARLARPHCVLVTPENDLYICDSFNHRIRRVDSRTDRISTVAGTGFYGGAGDGGPATRAAITYVGGFALDTTGSLLFTDIATHRIRRVDRHSGIITTIAGDGAARFAGDGGSAVVGSFDLPVGIHVDSGGNILVGDSWNGRVRRIDARRGTLSTVVGSALTPETPDWRFRLNYDVASVRSSSNRTPALRRPDANRVSVTDVSYTRRGLPHGMMSVFVPPGTALSERLPAVMLVHGRSNQEVRPRESGGMMSWARTLAASGLVAILPDHRLGGGGSAELSLEDLQSVIATVRAESARLNVDSDRVCFVTFSDGVGPVVPLLADTATRPRCLLAFYPMIDLLDPRHFIWSVESAETRQRMSLLTAVIAGRFSIPTFIARAGRDGPEVNEALARLERETARTVAPVTIVTHPTGRHGFERVTPDEDAARIMRQAIDFLIGNVR